MGGEYPKLLQENDFLKLKVEQLEALNKELRIRLYYLEAGEQTQELPNTRYFDGEIED